MGCTIYYTKTFHHLGGWYYDAWDYVRRSKHLSSDADYQYVAKDGKCNKGAPNSLTEG